MKDGMYNREIFWPDELEKIVQDFFGHKMMVCRTEHYDQRIEEYHLSRGAYRTALSGQVIEVVLSGNCVVKAVTKIPNRRREDKCIVFAISFCWDSYLERFVAIVKTAWENDKDDNHPTKDVKKYVQN